MARTHMIQRVWTSVVLVAVGAMTGAAADLHGTRPNIVLVMTDDQGYGDAGYMGHPALQTPVLDEMAANGLRLDNFRTASPVCSPTRASVLTGRHPTRIGVFRHGHALRPQERTVATLLREAGYRTGFFGKYHLGSVRDARPTHPGAHGFDEWLAAPNFYMNNPWFSHNGRPVQLRGEGSMVTVEAALPFIASAVRDDKPFLVFIWTGSPHIPHQATPELQALYADQPAQLRNYYGEITGIDRAVGRLRQALRKLNVEKDTLLMFTSDNGGRPQDGPEAKVKSMKASSSVPITNTANSNHPPATASGWITRGSSTNLPAATTCCSTSPTIPASGPTSSLNMPTGPNG